MNNENNGMNPNDPMMPNTNPGMTPMPEANPNPTMMGTPEVNTNPMDQNPNMGMGPQMAAPAPEMNPNMGPQMAGPIPDPNMAPNPNIGPTPNMGMNQMPNPNMAPNPNVGMNNPIPEEPKKDNKMFIIIVAVLAVVIIAVILIFVLGKGKNNNTTNNNTTNNGNTNTNTNPVSTANEYTISGYKFTVPSGYTAAVDGDYLELRNDGNTMAARFTVAKYENYSDYVNASDSLKSMLEGQGVTVTDVSESFSALKTWLILKGTMQDKFVEMALTDYKDGVAVALIVSTNKDMYDMYSTLSLMLDTATEDSASFAGNGEPQGIHVDISGLDL